MSKKPHFLAQYGNSTHLDKALKSNDCEVIHAGAQNPKISKEHVGHLIDDKENWVAHLGLSKNKSLSTEHVDKLADHPDNEVRDNALEHKNVSLSVFEKGLKNTDVSPYTHETMIEHSPHITKEHLTHVINNDFDYTKDAVRLARKDWIP